ncbi:MULTISPECIES: XtrA/YqaO family protein [Bacillus subtilis group]|uniref:XtrA/YqaO family protein n=1 Tax=Bacillus subtilis group TaxID=653685 RepID=UPI000F545DC7|nr:XtrA/YqaO family protein [Bacillus subtilis]
MNLPMELKDIEQTPISSQLKKGKITVIIIDGKNDKAYVAETPQYGKVSIQTMDGEFSRLLYDFGLKF